MNWIDGKRTFMNTIQDIERPVPALVMPTSITARTQLNNRKHANAAYLAFLNSLKPNDRRRLKNMQQLLHEEKKLMRNRTKIKKNYQPPNSLNPSLPIGLQYCLENNTAFFKPTTLWLSPMS
jgi:hypothetical protein